MSDNLETASLNRSQTRTGSAPDWAELAARLRSDSPDPLYRRVSSQIEDWIERGILRPGDQLASERQLTELLEVSRRTIRAALADLIERGYVTATHGRGNFVTEPPARRELRFLALERFERSTISPAYYNLLHLAEAANRVTVHYKYAPTIKHLRAILESPPEGYQGLLIVRPSQEWIDALLAMPSRFTDNLPVPLLVTNRDLTGSTFNFISPDHAGQAREATRQLIAAGHTRIGYVSGSRSVGYLEKAFSGYQESMRKAGLEMYESDQRHFENLNPEKIATDLLPFLQCRQFTGIVLNGSAPSVAFERAVQLSSIVIPCDLSAILVCEENALKKLTMRWSAVIYPDQHTVHRAIEVLSDLSRGRITPPVQELLTPATRRGATCGQPPPLVASRKTA